LAEEIEKKFGRLDVLINNAGCNWGEAYETYPESAWDKVLALNLKTVFFLTRACTPLLEKSAQVSNTPSRVINIGSIDGLRVSPLDTYAYSASKSGVHQLTKVLASKLSYKNITVNAIAAGFFHTKMMAETYEKFKDAIDGGTPMKRPGKPEDISGVCIYLSSKAGAWVTGSILTIDGGATITAGL